MQDESIAEKISSQLYLSSSEYYLYLFFFIERDIPLLLVLHKGITPSKQFNLLLTFK